MLKWTTNHNLKFLSKDAEPSLPAGEAGSA